MEDIGNELKSFFTRHWAYLSVRAACKLDLFEAIGDKPQNAIQIAGSLNCQPGPVLHLLRALCHLGMLDRTGEVYSLKTKSARLTESHPQCLKYACLLWGDEQMNALQNLDYTIRTGNSAFEKLHGMTFFDFIGTRQDKLEDYHRAMGEYARDDYDRVTEIVDFSDYRSVMDVGGGHGALISKIKRKSPDTICYLFDRPEAIGLCEDHGIEKLPGDFFEAIPSVSEAILLSRVIHDWDDEKAGLILRNCYDSLPRGAILYLKENFSELVEDEASLLSLNMPAICRSNERTSEQYRLLLIKAGFEIGDYKKLNQLQYILIAKK